MGTGTGREVQEGEEIYIHTYIHEYIRFPGDISITSYTQMHTTLTVESREEPKSFLMKVKEESEKAGLQLKFKKIRSWHPVPSLHGK